MGVYIKGIEMPKKGNWKTVRIYPDGSCAVPNWQGDCTFIKDAKAISIPSHGRLIDADSMEKQIDYVANLDWNRKVWASVGMFAALEIVEDALTIIESEGE